MSKRRLPSVLRGAALVLLGAGVLSLVQPGCRSTVTCSGNCNGGSGTGGHGGSGGHGGVSGDGVGGIGGNDDGDEPSWSCYDCACASDSPCLADCDAASGVHQFCTNGDTEDAACAACVLENCDTESLAQCLQW